jgi:hypothetical protein
MSTRSTIGIREKGGAEKRVYCHFDGYLSNNGRILLMHFDSEAKVRELLSLGDLSALGASIDGSVAYSRDRGEVLKPAGERAPQEYDYTFCVGTGRWVYRDHGSDESELTHETIERD